MSLFDKWKNKYGDKKWFKCVYYILVILISINLILLILFPSYNYIFNSKINILYVLIYSAIFLNILVFSLFKGSTFIVKLDIILVTLISTYLISLLILLITAIINFYMIKPINKIIDRYSIIDSVNNNNRCIFIIEDKNKKIDYIECNTFSINDMPDIIKNKEYFVTTTIEKGFAKKEYITVKYSSNLD